MVSNLYKAYLLIRDHHWQEAFLTFYANLIVIEMFNELILNIKHTMVLSILLNKIEEPQKAIKVLEYLRDLAEDTNNNKEAILIYEQLGRMYQ